MYTIKLYKYIEQFLFSHINPVGGGIYEQEGKTTFVNIIRESIKLYMLSNKI